MNTMLNPPMIDFDETQTPTRVHAAMSDAIASEPITATMPPSMPESPAPAGPLAPPQRKYLRPSAYWADRWLTVSKP